MTDDDRKTLAEIEARHAQENARRDAREARLRKALTHLSWVLCDPEGNPSFSGSDGDRRVAREAFASVAKDTQP